MGFIFSQFTEDNCTEFSEWLKDIRVSRHIYMMIIPQVSDVLKRQVSYTPRKAMTEKTNTHIM